MLSQETLLALIEIYKTERDVAESAVKKYNKLISSLEEQINKDTKGSAKSKYDLTSSLANSNATKKTSSGTSATPTRETESKEKKKKFPPWTQNETKLVETLYFEQEQSIEDILRKHFPSRNIKSIRQKIASLRKSRDSSGSGSLNSNNSGNKNKKSEVPPPPSLISNKAANKQQMGGDDVTDEDVEDGDDEEEEEEEEEEDNEGVQGLPYGKRKHNDIGGEDTESSDSEDEEENNQILNKKQKI